MNAAAKSLAVLICLLGLARGVGAGVVLPTGEEDYSPALDMIVPNPHGPLIYWLLSYETARGTGRDLPNGQPEYQSTDFGEGWTTNYNVNIYDEKADPKAVAPSPGDKQLYFSNGYALTVTAPAVPTADSPRVNCTLSAGLPYPLTVGWVYDAADPEGEFILTYGNGQVWTLSCISRASRCWVLTRITENGHSLAFHYTARPTPPANLPPFPLLDDIADAATGKALLTVRRDAQSAVESVTDCYGRSVFYHVTSYPTHGVPKPFAQAYQELDWVSQVVPTGTAPQQAPMRERYVYHAIPSGFHAEAEPLMTTCIVPSPTGHGEVARWSNSYERAHVTSQTDADGIVKSFAGSDAMGNPAPMPGNGSGYVRVTTTDAQGRIVQGRIYGFADGMTPISYTDLKGQSVPPPDDPGDPADPARPAAEKADEERAAWRWDNDSVADSFYADLRDPDSTYDDFGNVVTTKEVNGRATYSYTHDGDYTQPEAVDEPLTVTGPDGRVKHFRYDARGNVAEETDPGGQRTRYEYNLVDQLTRATFFGPKSAKPVGEVRYAYLYPGGQMTEITALNAAGRVVRHFLYGYEPAGHLASITGTRPPVQYRYDALYQCHLVSAPHPPTRRHS